MSIVNTPKKRNLRSKYVTITTMSVVNAIWLEGNDESAKGYPIAMRSEWTVYGRGRNIPNDARRSLSIHSFTMKWTTRAMTSAMRNGFHMACLVAKRVRIMIEKNTIILGTSLTARKNGSRNVPSISWRDFTSGYSRWSRVVKKLSIYLYYFHSFPLMISASRLFQENQRRGRKGRPWPAL